jgi:hypothetical protein
MTNLPIFISYHTGDSYYSSCAENLVSNIRSLGGEIIMEKVTDTGYYWKNTLKKPGFILSKMDELKRDLIWIDADTNIFGYTDCMKKWESDILFASHTGDIHGIKASPMGIKYSEKTLGFFKKFSDLCNHKIESNELDLDHDVLKYELLPDYKEKISLEILGCEGVPSDYTDGKYIRNGISRGINKGREVHSVTLKNSTRDLKFRMLSLNDFTI